MALLKIILPYQWRTFWRGMRARGAWGGTNLSLVVVLALWLLPGHVTSSLLAVLRMRADPAGSGLLLAEMNLTSLLIAWLLTPVLITGLQAHGEGVTPWRLALFPLHTRELMMVGVSGSMIHPGYWLLALASLSSLAPVFFAPYPLTGFIAGFLFFASAAMMSWALGLFGSVLFSSRRAREIVVLAIAMLAASVAFLADLKLDHRPDGFFATTWGRAWLLSDAAGERGLLPMVRHNTPGAWVMQVAVGREVVMSFALLLLWFAVSWNLAAWSLRRTIAHPVTGIGTGKALDTLGPIPFLPRAQGLLAGKELRYLLRTMDTILGMAIGLGGAAYLVLAENPSRLVLFFGIPIILMMEMAMPMNAFGLDRAGVDRYRLFPLSGRDVVLSKNAAFFTVVFIQVAPLLTAAMRFGALTALAALLGTATFALLMAIWGNVVSIRNPAPRAFYNFDSTEQAGGVASILYSAFVWLGPGLVAVFTVIQGPVALVLGQAMMFTACAVIYARLLGPAGALFDAQAERMRKRLAG